MYNVYIVENQFVNWCSLRPFGPSSNQFYVAHSAVALYQGKLSISHINGKELDGTVGAQVSADYQHLSSAYGLFKAFLQCFMCVCMHSCAYSSLPIQCYFCCSTVNLSTIPWKLLQWVTWLCLRLWCRLCMKNIKPKPIIIYLTFGALKLGGGLLPLGAKVLRLPPVLSYDTSCQL